MAAKVALEKNHHHLKVDQKEENPIDWKAVKAHISFVASKYKANVSRATLLNVGVSTSLYQSLTICPLLCVSLASQNDSNIPSEAKLASHHPDDKDHDVTLKPQGGGVLWTGPILFGGQKIYVDFDTGSTSVGSEGSTVINLSSFDG